MDTKDMTGNVILENGVWTLIRLSNYCEKKTRTTPYRDKYLAKISGKLHGWNLRYAANKIWVETRIIIKKKLDL